jgi:transposase InsO family protein
MPFGLCNAPQTMQKLMDKIVPEHLKESVFVYLDDLLVISSDFQTHIDTLKEVAHELQKANLTINVKKCKFLRKRVTFLGYDVGEGKVMTSAEKVKAIVEYPVPNTVRKVRRFLGMAGYYRRFVGNFAAISSPLTDRLKNPKGRFTWTPEAEAAFEALKKALSTAPVLSNPNFKKPFLLACDASKEGVGAVLSQEDDEGADRPIAFWSKKLNDAQKNYSISELECLAAVLGVKKFRHYIEGHEFTIITDHAALKWLMRQKDLSGRLARWSLKLQGYNFKIVHRKGVDNKVPDALSRVFSVDEISPDISTESQIDLSSEHFLTPEYKELLELADTSACPDLKRVDGCVYRKTKFATGVGDDQECWRLWLPIGLQKQALHLAHDDVLSAHGGIVKTLERLRRYYYWPKMNQSVKNYISKCEVCKCSKAPNQVLRAPMTGRIETERPWQHIFIDMIGPYPKSKNGNVAVLIVLDHLSKYVLTHPLKSMVTKNITKFLESVFHMFGVPETLMSDNGVQFRSKDFNPFLQKFGIKHLLTALYSPQANASERVNRSLITAIRSYLRNRNHNEWDQHLSAITCALRSGYHQSIGQSPYHALFGQEMITHGSSYSLLKKMGNLQEGYEPVERDDYLQIYREQARALMIKAFESNAARYNLRSRKVVLNEGQQVYRRNFAQSDASKGFNAKLAPKFIPAKVITKRGNALYNLRDIESKREGLYHTKDLKL